MRKPMARGLVVLVGVAVLLASASHGQEVADSEAVGERTPEPVIDYSETPEDSDVSEVTVYNIPEMEETDEGAEAPARPQEQTARPPAQPDPVIDAINREMGAGPDDSAPAGPVTTGRTATGNYSMGLLGDALKSLGALCLVLALILVVYVLVRKYGRKTPLLAGANLASVIGKVHLDRHVALHYVRTGGKVLVISVNQGETRLIAEFDENEFEEVKDIERGALADARPEEPLNSGDFLRELRTSRKQMAGEHDARDAVREDDEISSLRGDIQRLQHYLRENTDGGRE